MTTNATPDVEVGTIELHMRGEIEALRGATVDAITPSGALTLAPTPGIEEGTPPSDRVLFHAETGGGDAVIRVLEGAHDQIADKLGIPKRYYDRMLVDQTNLLCDNVNTWLRAKPEAKRLVRMLRPLTDDERAFAERHGATLSARAFLSDRFRPLDHGGLLDVVLPEIAKAGATVTEYDLSERYFHVRFTTANEEILQAFVEQQPRLGSLTEIASFGGSIRNSETGHAALSVKPIVSIDRCTNVLVVSDMWRVAHLGGRSVEEQEHFGVDTRQLDDAATFLKVRDRVIQMFSPEVKRMAASAIAEAAGVDLVAVLPKDKPLMEFVESVGRKFELGESELTTLQDCYVNEVANTGRSTRWSLSQAFTASAKSAETFQRRAEIQEVGWKVLKSPIGELIKAVGRN